MTAREWIKASFTRLLSLLRPVQARREPTPPTRLEGPMPYEPRETPDDFLGLLTGGLGFGQVPWLLPHPPMPLLDARGQVGWRHAAEDAGASAYECRPVSRDGREDDRAREARREEDTRQDARRDAGRRDDPFGMRDWLGDVGAALDGLTSLPDPLADGTRGDGGGASGTAGGQGSSANGDGVNGGVGNGGVNGGGGGGGTFDPPANPQGPGGNSGEAQPLGQIPGLSPFFFGLGAGAASTGAGQGGSDSGGSVALLSEASGGGQAADAAVKASLAKAYASTPLAFEQNMGQVDSSVRFLSRGPGFSLWMTQDALTFGVVRPGTRGADGAPDMPPEGRDVFRLRMVGADQGAEVFGKEQLTSRSNYFGGDDPSKWYANVPQFSRVEQRGVWQGIDLTLRAATEGGRQFEYDFTVRPGSSVSQILLAAEGVDGLAVDQEGRLLLTVGGRDLVMEAPVLYQDGVTGTPETRTAVAGRYVLREGGIGFEVTGAYDSSRALIVDPVFSFASYLGGSGTDKAYGVAVDGSGASYITGETASSGFPVTLGYDTSYGTNTDAFLTKMAPDGRSLVYSTFLGGSGTDSGVAVALDGTGAAYVTGLTTGSFPTTAGAFQTTANNADQSFLTKLSAAGDALSYSTYITPTAAAGPSLRVAAIAVDAAGRAYVAGATGGQLPNATGFDTSANGGTDAFLLAFNESGLGLAGTYYGSAGGDAGTGIALGAGGAVYLGGHTNAAVPTGVGAYQAVNKGGVDSFVATFASDLSALTYGTMIGGQLDDFAYAVAVDGTGRASITGRTTGFFVPPGNYPTTGGAYDTTIGVGSQDAFLSTFNATATALSYSTFLGGNGADTGYALRVDASGGVVLVGATGSNDFPTSGAPQPAYGTNTDGFLTRFDSTGTLTYSTYLGGTGADEARGLALDVRGTPHVVGFTASTDFPGVTQTYQVANAGGVDAFIARVLPRPNAPALVTVSSDTGSSATDRYTSDATLILYGTADANATVTIYREGVGLLGTASASALGTWSYDYSAVTLPEGTTAFTLKANDGTYDSDLSGPQLVHVFATTPDGYAAAPAATSSLRPEVRVFASSRFGMAATPTVVLDVDLNNNGSFADGGEANYASGTLTNGQATIKLPALSGAGTVRVQARALDLAGNQVTTAASTVVVSNAASPWVAVAQPLSVGPASGGDWLSVLGDVTTAHGLDLDTSPGTGQGGSPALVYHSSSVSQKPVIQVTLPSSTTAALPSNITMVLSFDGTAAPTVVYSTTGKGQGDVLTMALQASQTITTTDRYGYSVLVQVAGVADQNVTGSVFIVAQDSSPFGAGWGLSGVDRLVSIASDANGPAGMLRVLGSGGSLFYTGTSTFTSEDGDSGTLTVSGGTYTYSTPDGQSVIFDSNGYQKKWLSADGVTSIVYGYDGSDRLETVKAVDGTLNTVTYTGSTAVAFASSNSRVTTLTLSSGDMTKITDPTGGVHTFTYDADSRLTREQVGPNVESNYAYTGYGTVGTVTLGTSSSPTRTVVSPVIVQGIGNTPAAGTVYGSVTDAVAAVTKVNVDQRGRTQEVIDATGPGTQLTYTSGYVTKSTDALNRVTTYTRDAQGYVTKVTHPDLTSITYAYANNAFHSLTTVTNERGYTTTMGYDGSGRHIRTTDALGGSVVYEYTSAGLLGTMTDARGNTMVYEYDGNRRQTVAVDAYGNRTTTAYDSNGNVGSVKDARGYTTTYTNDALGRTTAVTDPLGKINTVTLDSAGLQTGSIDPSGLRGSVIYDPYLRGSAVQSVTGVGGAIQLGGLTTLDDAGRPVIQRDTAGYSTQSTLDKLGRTTRTTDAKGGTADTYYDVVGRVLASRDQMGRWTTQAYDTRDRVTSTTDSAGNVTGTGYDAGGNAITHTDALNKTTTTTYDALNRATGTLDALGRRTTSTYDANGNTTLYSDHKGNQTSTTFDKLNRAVAVTDGYGSGVASTTETAFDEVGNVKGQKDARGNWTTSTYDARNQRTETLDSLGNRNTYTYSDAGDQVTAKDALGKVTTQLYDSLRRNVGWTDALGKTTTQVLDARGATVRTIDPVLAAQDTLFDELGRNVGSLDSRGGLTRNVLDASGAIQQIVDPVGNVWRYEYDSAGRERTRFDPLNARTTTSYDADNRVTSVVDRLSRSIEYSYDDEDRRTREVWKDNAGVTLNIITYTFDDNSNVTKYQDNAGTITYTFDAKDRVESYRNVFGQALTYTYDVDSNVTQRTDSLGGYLTSTYDGNSQLLSRKYKNGSDEALVSMAYSGRGQLTTLTRYSDIAGSTLVGTTVYAHDDGMRVTSITNKDDANAVISAYTYAYDSADRVTTHTYSSGIGTYTYSGTKTYTYDTTSQVVGDTGTAYGYDANGNRNTGSYQSGTSNRMTNDGTFTLTYDGEGNLSSKSKGSGLEGWAYTWDNRNRLVNVTKTSNGSSVTLSVTYTYDAEDHKVAESRWIGGVATVTRYVWDGEDQIADLDGSNSILTLYVHGAQIDQPLVRIVKAGPNSGTKGFYIPDLQGTIRDIQDAATQTILYHADPAAFGTMAEFGTGYGDRMKFTGRELDPDTGLQNNRHRWYDVLNGVWISEDWIRFDAGDANLRRYSNNSPVNNSDSFGLSGSGIILPSNKLKAEGMLFLALMTDGALPLSAIFDMTPRFGQIYNEAFRWAKSFAYGKEDDKPSLRLLKFAKNKEYIANAARHMYMQAMLTVRYGASAANLIGVIHEMGENSYDTLIDESNNRIGREIGLLVRRDLLKDTKWAKMLKPDARRLGIQLDWLKKFHLVIFKHRHKPNAPLGIEGSALQLISQIMTDSLIVWDSKNTPVVEKMVKDRIIDTLNACDIDGMLPFLHDKDPRLPLLPRWKEDLPEF